MRMQKRNRRRILQRGVNRVEREDWFYDTKDVAFNSCVIRQLCLRSPSRSSYRRASGASDGLVVWWSDRGIVGSLGRHRKTRTRQS